MRQKERSGKFPCATFSGMILARQRKQEIVPWKLDVAIRLLLDVLKLPCQVYSQVCVPGNSASCLSLQAAFFRFLEEFASFAFDRDAERRSAEA